MFTVGPDDIGGSKNTTTLYVPSGIVVGQLRVSGTISGAFASFSSGFTADATMSGINITTSGILLKGVFSGIVGEFTSSLTVQGKVVIKDGDPVAVSSGEVHVISGSIYVTSGGTIPVSIVSGDSFATSQKLVSGLVTITSGTTILLGIIPLVLSGRSPTYSGQTLIVSNATSGMDSYLSGTPFFFFDFGFHSGLVNGLPPIISPIIIPAPIICLSGLVANTSGGQWNLTILYRQ